LTTTTSFWARCAAVLIVAGHLTVDAERRDEYVRAFADLVRRARRAPGCCDVTAAADPLDVGRVNPYEQWESWQHVTAWRKLADAPDVDIEVIHAQVAMWDGEGERSPFADTHLQRRAGGTMEEKYDHDRCRRDQRPARSTTDRRRDDVAGGAR